jgi:hypothetical protein
LQGKLRTKRGREEGREGGKEKGMGKGMGSGAGRGKFKGKPTGRRHFSTPEEMGMLFHHWFFFGLALRFLLPHQRWKRVCFAPVVKDTIG